MEKILQGVKSSYMFDLFLEIKPSYASFVTYKPGGTTVKVHLVDLDDQVVHAAVNVRAQLSNSVEEFKGQNNISIFSFKPRGNTNDIGQCFYIGFSVHYNHGVGQSLSVSIFTIHS